MPEPTKILHRDGLGDDLLQRKYANLRIRPIHRYDPDLVGFGRCKIPTSKTVWKSRRSRSFLNWLKNLERRIIGLLDKRGDQYSFQMSEASLD